LQLIDLSYSENLAEISINSDLPKLKYLYLHKCNLKNLQNFSKYFVQPGFDFNIDKNLNLTVPPKAILESGKKAIVNYFKSIYKEDKVVTAYLYEAKILIIGAGGVGKTSLAVKLIEKDNPLPLEKDTTYGIDIFKREFEFYNEKPEKKTLFSNIWDFGGQPLYRGTHQMFFSTKSLYILVDSVRENSTDYGYWLNTVEQLAGDNSKVLVCINKRGKHSPVYDKTGLSKAFGKMINKDSFIEIDLLNDTGKIENLQISIRDLLLRLPEIGDEISPAWVEARRLLNKENKLFINFSRYQKICEKAGCETDKKSLDALSDYFNRIGVFTHYYDDYVLRERVFLDSNLLVKIVYAVLDNSIIKSKKGNINKSDFDDI